jgi:predicted metal-dependent enzyme (double-stranded beta helix superfamily)
MSTAKLRDFITAMTRLADEGLAEGPLLEKAKPLLAALVAQDDWLPEEFAKPNPDRYSQYLLHCDPLERFSMVSFVWGPGQKTPIHDHMVWGLIGMLRGSEISTGFVMKDGRAVPEGEPITLHPGDVEAVSPTIGDIHLVENSFKDRTSISVHVYGGNIGAVKRHVFTPEGETKAFISGYSNQTVPNLWDRSKEAA